MNARIPSNLQARPGEMILIVLPDAWVKADTVQHARVMLIQAGKKMNTAWAVYSVDQAVTVVDGQLNVPDGVQQPSLLAEFNAQSIA